MNAISSPTNDRPPTASGGDPRLTAALEEYRALLEAGQKPDRAAFLARHADLGEPLVECLAGLELVHAVGPSLSGADVFVSSEPPDEPLIEPLGDFRIIREIGRGGMGVVYEAEQMSLGRRVALKVLPFAGVMDTRQLQRFKNEAHAAAQLHHTNIVPVHYVGCERGVHFYAMQYIEGESLADVIAALRRQSEPSSPSRPADEGTPSPSPLADEGSSPPSPLVGEGRGGGETTPYTPPPQPSPVQGEGEDKQGDGHSSRTQDTRPAGALSTVRSTRDTAYFRTVALLGIQAAEALDYAHQQGIVHRDIKPANLLVEGEPGASATGVRLWITDFGLAQVQSDTRLTITGDLVGTLRYMSPEQALAKRVVVDHRTDVYSLGATLYELLTLEPAFGGRDRQELLPQIAFEEPRPPRRVNRAVPTELETIVLKALEKNPADRYATAQELADDLRRFVADEPIRARRPSLVLRLRKWARRHQPVVWSGAATLLAVVAVIAGSIGWMARDRAARRAKTAGAFEEAVQQADLLMKEENWPGARAAAKRAADLLADISGHELLDQRLKRVEADLNMAAALEFARLRKAEVKDGKFDVFGAQLLYADAFQDYNLTVFELEPDEVARRITASAIREQLLAALFDWSMIECPPADLEKLLAVVRLADSDTWRQQAMAALADNDWARLTRLTQQPEALGQPAAPLVSVAYILGRTDVPAAVSFLRQAQQRHPDDFWINHELANQLTDMKPPQLDEAIGFYRAALALRPQSPAVHHNLGIALSQKGRLDEAIAAFSEAIRLKADFAQAHYSLANTLKDQGQLDNAIAEYREAIRFKKDDPEAHTNLGVALGMKGLLDEAIDEFREGIRLDKNVAAAQNKNLSSAHNGIGRCLTFRGFLDDAIKEFEQAIQLDKEVAQPHTNLGDVLAEKGQLDKALAEYSQAIQLKADYVEAWHGRGNVYRDLRQYDQALAHYSKAIELKHDDARGWQYRGQTYIFLGHYEEAITDFREAIRIKQDDPEAHNSLGFALRRKRLLDEAIEEFRTAISLKKDFTAAYSNLGIALHLKGRFDEAIAAFREALRLDKNAAAGAHNSIGLCLKDKGLLDDAIKEFQYAIQIDKKMAQPHNNLGDALAKQGKFGEAVDEYQKAIQIKNDYANPHNSLAWVLATCAEPRLRDPARAVAAATRAVELQPKEEFFWQTLGWAQYRAGNWQAAIRALHKVKELGSPGDSLEWFPLAMACWQSGQKDEARRWYDRAVEWMDKNDPSNEFLRRTRAEAAELMAIKEKKN